MLVICRISSGVLPRVCCAGLGNMVSKVLHSKCVQGTKGKLHVLQQQERNDEAQPLIESLVAFSSSACCHPGGAPPKPQHL